MCLCLVPVNSIYARLFDTSPLCHPFTLHGLPRLPVPSIIPIMTSLTLMLFFILHTCPNNTNFLLITACTCICTHSVDPSLTHFLGEFQGLGLALEPDVVVPEAEQGCAGSRNIDSNFCPGWGRISDLGI